MARFLTAGLLLAMMTLMLMPFSWGDPNQKPNAIGAQLRSSLGGSQYVAVQDTGDSQYAHLGQPRAPLFGPNGEVVGTYNAMVIRIEGELVNHDAIIMANAAKIRIRPDSREEVTSLVTLDDTVFLTAGEY